MGAIVGAIIGGTTAAYQCSNYGGGSCTEGVSTGAIIGAAAGAAGGASSWAAGGFALDAAASASGGLAANMTLGEAVGLSALSVGAGSGASYTASYALSTPFDDWDLDDFFTGFNTSVISGAVVGAAMGAASWGISSHANKVIAEERNQIRKVDENGKYMRDKNGKIMYKDGVEESKIFVDREYGGLRRGPTDGGEWKSSRIKKEDYPELYETVKNKFKEKQDDILFKNDFRFSDGSNLHVKQISEGVFVGHYDYHYPFGNGLLNLPLHGYEALRGKTPFNPFYAYSGAHASFDHDNDGLMFW